MSEQFLTISDAAKVIGISDRVLRHHIRLGLLETVMVKKWEVHGPTKKSIPKDDVAAVRLEDAIQYAHHLKEARKNNEASGERSNPAGYLRKLREIIKASDHVVESPGMPKAFSKGDL